MLVTAGLGILASSNGYGEDATKAEEMVTQLEKLKGKDDAAVVELRTTVSGYKTSSTGALILAFLSIVLLGVTFMKKEKPQLIVVGGMIGIAILFIILSPSIEMSGLASKADPRQQAMMVGIPAILAAVFAFGAEKLRQKNAA